MNCSTCSHELKPSDPKCPQCGAHNPHHAQFLWKLIKQQVTDIPPGLKGSPIEQSLTTPEAESFRSMIFEVIVQRAIKGHDWRTACRGPMELNGISPNEIEAELKKRGHGGADQSNEHAAEHVISEADRARLIDMLKNYAIDPNNEWKRTFGKSMQDYGIAPEEVEQAARDYLSTAQKSMDWSNIIKVSPDTDMAQTKQSVIAFVAREAIDGKPWRELWQTLMNGFGVSAKDVELETIRRIENELEPDYDGDDKMSNFTDVRDIVRAQVLAVIVEQALAGREWRETCAEVMKLNGISVEEIEEAIKTK